MIGQSRCKNEINGWIANGVFPNTLLIVAPLYYGKALLAEYVAKTLKSEYDIDYFVLEELNASNVKYFVDLVQSLKNKEYIYIIKNLSNTNNLIQNILLKVIEENSNVKFIITATSDTDILPTILSRCIKLEMDKYSQDELLQALNYDEQKLSYVDNIYECEMIKLISIDDIIKYVSRLYENCVNNNFLEVFNLISKIDFINDITTDKYPIKLVLKVFKHKLIKIMWSAIPSITYDDARIAASLADFKLHSNAYIKFCEFYNAVQKDTFIDIERQFHMYLMQLADFYKQQ